MNCKNNVGCKLNIGGTVLSCPIYDMEEDCDVDAKNIVA
jgi:hypothetical protein